MAKKVNIDQDLLEMLAPVQTFDVMGVKINARELTISDYAELKKIFKDWQSFDLAELYNESRFDAFGVIVWLGIREDTPKLKNREMVNRVINMRTFQAWMPVFTYISGVEIAIDAADDELPPETETDNSSKKS